MTLGIDRVVRSLHEAHVLLVRREPPPGLADVLQAQQHISVALGMSRHITALMGLGIYELAPTPPPIPAPGPALFDEQGGPAVFGGVAMPDSDDPYTRRQRINCASEVMGLIDELGEVPAVELMNNLSKSWDRDKIVRPVMKRLTESGVLDCSGNTRGAVYSKGSDQPRQDKTGTD